MTKQKVSHKESEDNENFVSEKCFMCGIEIVDIEEIWTDLDSGNYVCKDCDNYHKLNARQCKEIY